MRHQLLPHRVEGSIQWRLARPGWGMRQPDIQKIGRVFNKIADRYDRQMGFWERLLFDGGRQWAVSRACGHILEIAVGTGLNLPLYPVDATMLGSDLSERMLDHPRRRAVEDGMTDRVMLRRGMSRRWIFLTTASTRSCPRLPSTQFPTRSPRPERPFGYSGLEGGSFSPNMDRQLVDGC